MAIRKLRKERQITVPKLDMSSVYIAGYADAGFANNKDLPSQLGFIVLLKDVNDNSTIMHYGSWKCHRVTRSVLGAEFCAFSHCLDYLLTLSYDLLETLGRRVKAVMFSDSKSLFDTITKLSTVSDKNGY